MPPPSMGFAAIEPPPRRDRHALRCDGADNTPRNADAATLRPPRLRSATDARSRRRHYFRHVGYFFSQRSGRWLRQLRMASGAS